MLLGLQRRLEINPHTQLELTHLDVAFQGIDDSGGGIVDGRAGSSLVDIECVDRVVEDVEELRSELSFHSLRNAEGLEEGHVGLKLARAGKGVALDVSEVANTRIREGTGLCHNSAAAGRSGCNVAKRGSERSEETKVPGLPADASMEATAQTRPTRPGISIQAAVLVARRPR